MANLWDDENVFTPAPGDDRGIWFEDIIALHSDIREVEQDWYENVTWAKLDQNPGAPVWHIHSSFQYLYCGANNGISYYPVCLPVGCVINAVSVRVLGTGGANGGTIDFYEYSVGGTLVSTTAVDGGVANPWQVAVKTTYNPIGVSITVKPMHYYYFHIEAASNAAANQCNLYRAVVKYKKCDH